MTGPRRPVALSQREPVAVRFAGDRTAEGPLTLGQENIWYWLTGVTEPPYAAIGGALDLPAGARVGDVAAALAVLLARHEGLRTTYRAGDPPVQVVAATGTLPLAVYAVEPDRDGRPDRAALTAALHRRLRAAGPYRFDELPLRAALAVEGDAVHAAAITYSHLAVDYQAMEVLRRELVELVADPATRQPGPRRLQPLDLARSEAAVRSGAQAERTLRYWAEQLTRMPNRLWMAPRTGAVAGSLEVELTSAAAAQAVHRVVARTGTSRASAVLAAVCAVLSLHTGYPRLVFPVLSGNRFSRRLADYVGTLAQTGMAAVDVGTAGFDTLVHRAWAGAVQAGRYGQYEIPAQRVVKARVERERGVFLDMEPLFNSAVMENGASRPAGARVPAGPVPAGCGGAVLRCRPMPATPTLMRFDLTQTDPRVRLSLWTGDTSRLPQGAAEVLLRGVEALLVAAGEGDLDRARMRAVVAAEPAARGPGWLWLDSCWVELAAVQELLDDALGPAPARVFASVAGRPLVAYLAASGAAGTPEQAHARCLAVLPDHPQAMAPRHYVVCARPPADPGDLAGWRAVQPAYAGSGRDSDLAGGPAGAQPPGRDSGPPVTGPAAVALGPVLVHT